MRVFLDATSQKPHVSIGSQAMILGAMNIVAQKYPTATFVLISTKPDLEAIYLNQSKHNVEILPRSKNRLLKFMQIRQVIKSVDIVVTVYGDAFITSPSFLLFFKAMNLKKKKLPLIMFTASIKPSIIGWQGLLTKMGLALFDELTFREPATKTLVARLGISNANVYSDTAYAWPACDDRRINKIFKDEAIPIVGSYVGINTSMLLYHEFNKRRIAQSYVDLICKLIHYFQGKYGLKVLLIPHQLCYDGTPLIEIESRDGDDRLICKRILGALADSNEVYTFKGFYSAADYKGIISKCELFVGGRMHSVIAGVATLTPSLLMQYSHKAMGVMEMLDMTEYLWDIEAGSDDLFCKVDKLWNNRLSVTEQLKLTIPKQINSAFDLVYLLEKHL